MNKSEIIPELALKSFLEGKGVSNIYHAGIPTSGVQKEFVTISLNGPITAQSEDSTILQCVITVGAYAELLTNKTTNFVKEKIVMGKFSELFPTEYTYEGHTYAFRPDLKNLVFSGRNLYSGYSTKALNIQVTIY